MAEAARQIDRIDTAPRWTQAQADALNARFVGVEAGEMLKALVADGILGNVAVVSSFGTESAVLLHLVAQADKAMPVIFVDTLRMFPETIDYRNTLIEALGFTTIDPRETDQVAWVEQWTGGAGADVVFEVSGAAAAVLGATDLAKVRGTIVVVAIHPTPREINLQRVFWRELRLLGARVYQRVDFETAIELIADGVIPTELMITRVVPLVETRAAFDDLEAGRAMKILVDVAAR